MSSKEFLCAVESSNAETHNWSTHREYLAMKYSAINPKSHHKSPKARGISQNKAGEDWGTMVLFWTHQNYCAHDLRQLWLVPAEDQASQPSGREVPTQVTTDS